MRTALLMLAATLVSCHPRVLPAPVEEVSFPQEWAGAKLDFEVLRAIKVAAGDFMPPHPILVWLFETEADRCIWSPRSLDYEIMETPDVVFVRLHVNPAHCGVHRVIADAGARYAVRRSDGVILRALSAAEPDELPPMSETSGLDASTPPPPAELSEHDGGTSLDAGLGPPEGATSDGGIDPDAGIE